MGRVVLNPTADDFGLGGHAVNAVAIFYMDHAVASLRFAQMRGVPHIGISTGVSDHLASCRSSPGAGILRWPLAIWRPTCVTNASNRSRPTARAALSASGNGAVTISW